MDSTTQGVVAAIGSFVAVTVVFAAIYVICRLRRQRENQARVRTRTVHNSDLSSIEISESASFDPTLNQISMAELLRATQNFATERIIGDGSFGLVYKAELNNGLTVAVKKLGADAFQGYREFLAEMETLSKLQHPNIVKILGYYATGSDRILVYEFIEKGNLDQWLYDTSSSSSSVDNMSASITRFPLSWDLRIRVVKGVATGLTYMHNLDTPIIHRDIKASNVLLDSNFEAHIADFGLARRIERSHSHVSTQVAGTMGYMPPEYIHGASMATTLGDIYSFGILMLEIAMGRRPNWPFKDVESGKEIGLLNWATKMVAKNRQMELVDPNIPKKGLREVEVVEYFKIATMCANETSRYRPPMKEVVEMLNRLHSIN